MFVSATPVSILDVSADVSAYTRKAFPAGTAGTAGTPAADTVTPSLLKEKIALPNGVGVPASGITRIQPVVTDVAVRAAVNSCELRGGIEYVILLAVNPDGFISRTVPVRGVSVEFERAI